LLLTKCGPDLNWHFEHEFRYIFTTYQIRTVQTCQMLFVIDLADVGWYLSMIRLMSGFFVSDLADFNGLFVRDLTDIGGLICHRLSWCRWVYLSVTWLMSLSFVSDLVEGSVFVSDLADVSVFICQWLGRYCLFNVSLT